MLANQSGELHLFDLNKMKSLCQKVFVEFCLLKNIQKTIKKNEFAICTTDKGLKFAHFTFNPKPMIWSTKENYFKNKSLSSFIDIGKFKGVVQFWDQGKIGLINRKFR